MHACRLGTVCINSTKSTKGMGLATTAHPMFFVEHAWNKTTHLLLLLLQLLLLLEWQSTSLCQQQVLLTVHTTSLLLRLQLLLRHPMLVQLVRL